LPPRVSQHRTPRSLPLGRSSAALARDAELLERGLDRLLQGIIELQRQRLAEIGDGAVVLAREAEGVAAVLQVQRLAWVELDRLVVICDRAIVLPLAHIDVAAVVEGGAIVGNDADDLVIILERAVLVSPLVQIGVEVPLGLVLIGERAVEEGRGKTRIEGDRPVEILDGAVVAPL